MHVCILSYFWMGLFALEDGLAPCGGQGWAPRAIGITPAPGVRRRARLLSADPDLPDQGGDGYPSLSRQARYPRPPRCGASEGLPLVYEIHRGLPGCR